MRGMESRVSPRCRVCESLSGQLGRQKRYLLVEILVKMGLSQARDKLHELLPLAIDSRQNPVTETESTTS